MVRGRRAKPDAPIACSNGSDCPKKRNGSKLTRKGKHNIRDYFKIESYEDNLNCKYKTEPSNLSSDDIQPKFADINNSKDNFFTLDQVKNLNQIFSPSTPHRIQLELGLPESNVNRFMPEKLKINLKKKIKSELKESKSDHKLTDYFPIRRSVRKTKRTVLEEKQKNIEQLIRDGIEEGLEVHDFEGKGRGVVAVKPFNRGDFVVEYSGELLDVAIAKQREEIYSQDINTGCYMYYFKYQNQQYCIDATAESGRLGRLVNHSRSGNLLTRTIIVDGLPRLILIAKEYISIGEEICYDYGDRSKESLKNHPWLAF